MSMSPPLDDSLSRLPVELTDYIIDCLDPPSLISATMVAKSWRVRAMIRLYRRLEISSGGSATCGRSRMPRRSCVQMSCATFVELLERDEARFRPVRELHLVFAGSRLSFDAPRVLDAFLNAVRRLPFCDVEHLGMYSFPTNLRQTLNGLMAGLTNLRSLHLVDFNTVDVDMLLFHARLFPRINMLAVLEGGVDSSIDFEILHFTPNWHRADSNYISPNNCQVFLAPNTMGDLLTWVAHAPQTGRTLNIVGVRPFTFDRGLEELLATHTPLQLDDIMSCVRSVEIVIDYEDKYHRLVKLLQAFRHVPVLQLTFDSDGANLEIIARLLRETKIDWSFLQHIIFAPRSPAGVNEHPRPSEWDLIDTALAAEHQHQSSLHSAVVSLRADSPPAADCLSYLPQVQQRGIVHIVRRESDTTHGLFLIAVVEDIIAQMI